MPASSRLLTISALILAGMGRSWAADVSDEIQRFPRDAAYVVASPLRLSSYDWVIIPIAGGALAVTMAYDGPIRDRLVHLRHWGGQAALRSSGDILQFSGIAAGVGLMAYGKEKEDAEMIDNGWVQLEGGATAASIGYLLKWSIGRGRPGGDDPDYFKAFNANASFPSGHTLMAFTAAEIASEEYPSWWVRVPSTLIATSVGVSRIAADQHWMGDVLASALLGTGIGHAIFKVHHRPSKDWRLLATGKELQVIVAFK